jgi:hypothetical protein
MSTCRLEKLLAVQLRDSVRAVILAGCGEPDLGELIKPAQPDRG